MKFRVFLCLLIVLCLMVGCLSLGDVTWKIAIVTGANSQNDEEFRAAENVKEKYGEDHVLIATYTDEFINEKASYIQLITQTAKAPGVKVLIINPSVEGTYEAVKAVRKDQPNLFIIVANPAEHPDLITPYADIVFDVDPLRMGRDLVEQAERQGAKTFVHYTFERHMNQPLLAERRDYIKENCEARDIEFVDVTVLDPAETSNLTKSRQYIIEKTNEYIGIYGKDTAFFATNCGLQVPLISAVYEGGGIYPQPCCPSPYHGFTTALGIELPDDKKDNLDELISEITRKVEEKNMSGRMSTWPVPVSMMFTEVSADYGKAWIEGDFTVRNNIIEFKTLWEEYSDETYEIYTLDDYDNYYLFSYEYLTF